MRHFVGICMFFVTTCHFGQTFQWLKTSSINYNMNPSMISYPTATDGQNNTYISGFKENITFDVDVFGTVFLTKHASNGDVLWSKNLVGDVHTYKLRTDSAGNLYTAIAYLTNVSIDQLNLTAADQRVRPLLLKFSPDGQLLWHKLIPGEFTSNFTALTIDNQDRVYIGYDDYMTSTIQQLNSEGDVQQTITQAFVKLISSIDVDTEGNIYAVGSCAETDANFNGTARPAPFLYNTYVVKYSQNGAFQWMHYVEDVTCIQPAIKVRTPDEVYFCSALFENFPVGTFPMEGPVNGRPDFFLTRLNAAGNFVWVREVPGVGSLELGKRNFIDLDASGNIYLTGQTRGLTSWSNTVSTQATGNSSDITVIKYTPDGTPVWAKTAAGTGEDRVDGVTLLSDDSVILSGLINGSATFDQLSHVGTMFNYYPFLAKIDTSALSVHQPEKTEFTVSPNPASGWVDLKSSDLIGKVRLYNLLGQLVQSETIEAMQGTLNLSDLASGVYLLQPENRSCLKIIKQ